MPISLNLPNIEVVYFLLAVGAIGVIFTSLGALLRLWSWKTPRDVAYAFIGVALAFVIISWLYGRMGNS